MMGEYVIFENYTNYYEGLGVDPAALLVESCVLMNGQYFDTASNLCLGKNYLIGLINMNLCFRLLN